MPSVMRVKEPNGKWRQLSIADAASDAYRHLLKGDSEKALELMEKAVQFAPRVPAVLYLLGVAQLRQNKYSSAVSSLRRAVQIDAANPDYLVSLSEALMPEEPAEATTHFIRAIQLGTKTPEAFAKLSMLLSNAQNPEEALHVCNLGLERYGAHPCINASRAFALLALAQPEEALKSIRVSETETPNDLASLLVTASVLLGLNRVAEARAYLEQAIRIEPNSAEAHFNLGITHLLEGNLLQGFRECEWRWQIREMMSRTSPFKGPAWNGSDLHGARILLHPEQGAGDVIQFVRYAEFVRARGGQPIILAPKELVRLLTWLPDCEVATIGASDPVEFHAHCPMLSLPALAGTEEQTIPPPAPFTVPVELQQKWSEILGGVTINKPINKRIGVVWAGNPSHKNDRNRSLPYQLLEPLLNVPNTEWFSLQVGPASAQLSGRITNLAPHFADYAETAAAISQLDLVITADTSVAHLAASIGKPTWVLIPFAPDWRWLMNRTDSPWYPTMRLFRQPTVGDWQSVIREIGYCLS